MLQIALYTMLQEHLRPSYTIYINKHTKRFVPTDLSEGYCEVFRTMFRRIKHKGTY